MKAVLKKLVLVYLKEVSSNEYSDEDLEYMADKFAKDVCRIRSARRDFREVD